MADVAVLILAMEVDSIPCSDSSLISSTNRSFSFFPKALAIFSAVAFLMCSPLAALLIVFNSTPAFLDAGLLVLLLGVRYYIGRN